MRTRIWHSDWKPRWLIRCVSAALLSFMDKQENEYSAGRLNDKNEYSIGGRGARPVDVPTVPPGPGRLAGVG